MMKAKHKISRKKFFLRILTILLPVLLITGILFAVSSCAGHQEPAAPSTSAQEESSSTVPSEPASSAGASSSEIPAETSSAEAFSGEASSVPAASQAESEAPSSRPASSAAPPPASSAETKPNSGIYAGVAWRSPYAQTADIFKHGRELMLLNNYYELPEDFQWDLVLWSTGEPVDAMSLNSAAYDKVQAVDAAAYQPLKDMFAAAKADGVPLQLVSPYRSISLQDRLFGSLVTSYMNAGMSRSDAIKKANVQRTFTGTSEHNTGLGFDLSFSGNWSLTQAFDQTAQFKWLQQHAAEYGFILRYAADKVDITGIMYEPWHYRYVGVEHAKQIREKGMCLEEYIEYLDQN